ncbi:50S ribosomal protein L29 [Gloeocapsa sp. PCC 73106]|uniref:50S ribosomal protein L29 n=1 Tax=Gloeocapsa sp. PCC 73106 TaxID=102232 RepID=UPI0002AD0810|nr:50S ribosomal protein L29 [Gloeocapsa sp. PCC 73106]ELR98828.1 ribosomal protein L29 [Gloeocapsa sp. PCC 73106]
MALTKIADVRILSDAEIEQNIQAVKRELFNLRLQQATGRLEKTHLFKHKRHYLGQLLTVERERQLNSASQPVEEE